VNRRARMHDLAAPVVGLVAFFGLWELLVRAFRVQAFVLQKPSTILSNLNGARSLYWHNALVTGREALLGFGCGLVLALVLATPMALSRFVEHAVQPVAVLIQVTPIIAYAPAVVIWQHGSTARSVLVLTTLVSFVPFLFSAVTGLRSVDPATLELLRSVDASGREIYVRLRLPNALPYLFAAGRIAVGLSLIGAVLGEWFGLADNRHGGLGALIKSASNQNNAPELWAATLALSILGGLAVFALTALERTRLRWHSSQQ
jgi:NitT/TauT family transport system permease protein